MTHTSLATLDEISPNVSYQGSSSGQVQQAMCDDSFAIARFVEVGTSEYSREIRKNPAIQQHNPGCQGYCIPTRCNRAARCHNCGDQATNHSGPHGVNCTNRPKCANCYGPHKATHTSCPAAPSRSGGRLTRLNKKELTVIRQAGRRAAQQALAALTQLPSTTSTSEPGRSPNPISTQAEAIPEATAKRGHQNTQGSTTPTEPPSNPEPLRRPTRTATSRTDLNLRRLSARSILRRGDPENINLSSSEQEDIDMNDENTSC
jgi:hypothetical protein